MIATTGATGGTVRRGETAETAPRAQIGGMDRLVQIVVRRCAAANRHLGGTLRRAPCG